jgi:uncharacterized membrane protein YccC
MRIACVSYFKICDKRNATLRYATQRYATQRNATQRYATHRYATLRNATLRYATQRYATLRNATQRYATLRNATHRYATQRDLPLPDGIQSPASKQQSGMLYLLSHCPSPKYVKSNGHCKWHSSDSLQSLPS